MRAYKFVVIGVLILLFLFVIFAFYWIEKKLQELQTLRKELSDIEAGKLEIHLKDIGILMSKLNQQVVTIKHFQTYRYMKETK